MNSIKNVKFEANDEDSEKASNSYLMSLVVVIIGLPLPIINLIATFVFFLSNRKENYFVRWHCTQALLSQLTLFFVNSYSIWWTISIFLGGEKFSNNYFAYLFIALFFNIIELITTIYSAIKTRKGIHVEWWFFSSLTNLICKP